MSGHEVVAGCVRRPPLPNGAGERLAAREREVVELVAAGCSNGEIAAELRITESTVKTRLARAQQKLGLRDRVHVVIWAYENGLAGRSGV
jgi:DNA-binding NarL/FixJ family response regulator